MIVTLVAWCARAQADGLVITGGSPRAIGRAGVGTASDDGGGALLVNPAAMARRDAKRAQLGVSFIEDDVDWLPARNAPDVRDQAGSSTLPFAAAEAGIGDWVIGLGVMTSAVSERSFAAPGSLPPDQLGNQFEYRYAGISGSQRRDTVTAGVARRLGDAVAVGLAFGASRVTVTEARRVWGGFAGRENVGDPAHDIDVAIAAEDDFVPNATAGLLFAPADTRVELAASIDVSGSSHLDGTAAASGSTDVSVEAGVPTSHVVLRPPVTLRTGARWLGERWAAEVDGDLWVFPNSAQSESWELTGLTVVDRSGVHAPLSNVPSRISQRTHGAARAAIDVALISGFLWATAGYAYASWGTPASRLSPTFADLGGHTGALGLEIDAGGFTLTMGWAHTWSVAVSPPNTAWRLDNPFGAGDGPVAVGRYDGSTDLVGLMLDAELNPN